VVNIAVFIHLGRLAVVFPFVTLHLLYFKISLSVGSDTMVSL
jgi:hypothetical protein